MKEHISKLRTANSPIMKVLFILAMTMALMIPNGLIQNLIQERSKRKSLIENEVSQSFGHDQKIMAPILRIPYTVTYLVNDGKDTTTSKGILSRSPQKSEITGDINTSTRKRSIYDIVVYDADLDIASEFNTSILDEKAYQDHAFHYDEAYLIFGLSDPNGLSDSTTISAAGQALKLNGLSTFTNTDLRYIKTTPFTYEPGQALAVHLDLKFKGTGGFNVEPSGNQMKVSIKSPWQDPSFVGSQLPDHHDVNEGFTSTWTTNQFAHDYPAFWSDDHKVKNRNFGFGVKLIQPVSEYGKNSRTAKYALLIISLTFGIFFFFEILQKKRVHPIQYILIGFALTVFYLLLLSITEHLGFDLAYLISSIATIGLIVAYARHILQSRRSTIVLGLLLSGLFSYIFVILQMQEFALLAGSLALFTVLSLVMMLSRKVDWYEVGKPLAQSGTPAPQQEII